MAVIKSAASAPSAKGGCASSRLDHGLKFYVIQGGCAGSRLIHGFFFAIFGRASGQIIKKNWVLAPLGLVTLNAVRESVNKSAASVASPDYVKFQAVIKSAASAASPRGGRASGRLDHGIFSRFLAALAARKSSKSRILLKPTFFELFGR